MDNKAFATELYEFLMSHDTHSYYQHALRDDCISELESYLSNLQMVKKTIKDIEEISDTFDDHRDYITKVKPLIEGLRDITEKLEAKERIRMVGNTNYKVKHAIHTVLKLAAPGSSMKAMIKRIIFINRRRNFI